MFNLVSPRALLQSCFPAGSPSVCPGAGAVPPQGQDSALLIKDSLIILDEMDLRMNEFSRLHLSGYYHNDVIKTSKDILNLLQNKHMDQNP